MGEPASSTTADIYMQTHGQTAISTALQFQKFRNNLLMKFILFLHVRTWKNFSTTSAIFIKTLSLLWRKEVVEN